MNHDQEEFSRKVGVTLRRLRHERGLSLQAFADQIQVSKLTLGKMERGEANPSLSIIWKIANGLSIPISTLLHQSDEVAISRKHSGQMVVSADENCILETMFETFSVHASEIHRATLKPRSTYEPGAHQIGVMEYVTVMSGEVIIVVEDEPYHLFQHDGMKFHGDRHHAYTNPTDEETVLHFVMTYTK